MYKFWVYKHVFIIFIELNWKGDFHYMVLPATEKFKAEN